MEFVKTPTFWCPLVDQAACTNFNLLTIELRPPEIREIFPFPFLLSHFPLFPSLRTVFPFSLLFSFLLFLLFFFLFSFLISFSPLIFSSFLLVFLLLFGAHHSYGQRRQFPPHFLMSFVWPSLFLLFLLFLICYVPTLNKSTIDRASSLIGEFNLKERPNR